MKYFDVFKSSLATSAYICLTALAVAVSFTFGIKYAVFMLIVCTAFTAVHFAVTYARRKKILKLASDINKLVHNDIQVDFDRYSEGELSVLQSEIYKMTVKLREQQYNLKKDKVYLADSIADISHQIRTPLTSVNLLVTMLSKPDISTEKRIETVHRLYEMLSHIDRLITVLLKISKLDAGTVKFSTETVSLENLIERSCEPLRIPIELREQVLETSAEGNFTGDVQWTCEALGNIVKNCMEHTERGGEIRVSAVENPLFSEIVISDSGKGISEKDLPHVFERFYKGQDSDDNSFGIGLALSRMIIKNQNGTIKAGNRRQGGAEFTVRFYKSAV